MIFSRMKTSPSSSFLPSSIVPTKRRPGAASPTKSKPPIKTEANIPTKKEEEIEDKPPVNEEFSSSVESVSTDQTKTQPSIDEQEYQRKLNQKIREAQQRLEVERQREEERQRQLEFEEHEREQEQIRLVEEQRRVEQERLQRAIEECERDNELKRQEEQRLQQQREEFERKQAEETERLNRERQEKAKKEEEERNERKKTFRFNHETYKTNFSQFESRILFPNQSFINLYFFFSRKTIQLNLFSKKPMDMIKSFHRNPRFLIPSPKLSFQLQPLQTIF